MKHGSLGLYKNGTPVKCDRPKWKIGLWREVLHQERYCVRFALVGQVELRRMSSQAVLLIVQKRAAEAGVESFSPHDFRRTFQVLESTTVVSGRSAPEIKINPFEFVDFEFLLDYLVN